MITLDVYSKDFYYISIECSPNGANGVVKHKENNKYLAILTLYRNSASFAFCPQNLLAYDYTRCVDILNVSLAILCSLMCRKISDSHVTVSFSFGTPISKLLIPVYENMKYASCKDITKGCCSYMFNL